MKSTGEAASFTAIFLSVGGARNPKERRKLARKSVRSIMFRGVTRTVIGWLLIGGIPLRHKLWELCAAPMKAYRFLSGQCEEAAILQWTSENKTTV